jgi:hypothetical protein
VMVIATTIFTMTATATSAEKSAPKHEVTARSSKRPPPVVDGVPLLALAKHALGAAEEYSVSKPAMYVLRLPPARFYRNRSRNPSVRSSPNTSSHFRGDSLVDFAIPPKSRRELRRS